MIKNVHLEVIVGHGPRIDLFFLKCSFLSSDVRFWREPRVSSFALFSVDSMAPEQTLQDMLSKAYMYMYLL